MTMGPPPGYRNAPLTSFDNEPVDLAEAEDFLGRLHAEHPSLGPVADRLARVREQVAEVGTYTHTGEELVFGARMAWRNASRCIGRVYWNSLVVRDLRGVTGADATAEQLTEHLRVATGERRGRLRAVISIFPQAVPGRPRTVLWNEQLIRYAGYPDGTGDPQYLDFTTAVTALGWHGKGSPFDVLPLVLQEPDGPPRLYELPEQAVLEVPLSHPELTWFTELGLRWHAVPAIANMRLSIGGVSYPLAPFSGWYMGSEIGARNLADADRYHQLPVIAERLGLDTSHERTLWRDRALLELNRAVLHSYQLAGVRITDHHTESRLFLAHIDKEAKAGRTVPADWSWIVPPVSGGATPVFHRYYTEEDRRPNFYLDTDAQERSRCPMAPVRAASAPEPVTREPGAREPVTRAVGGAVSPVVVPEQRRAPEAGEVLDGYAVPRTGGSRRH